MNSINIKNTDEIIREFKQKNVKSGYIQARVTADGGKTPLPSAKVTVYRLFGDEEYIFKTLYTTESGNTEIIPLPAPDIRYPRQNESEASDLYVIYEIKAEHEGYETAICEEVPVYEGVTSFQQLNLTLNLTAVTPVT